MTQTYQPVATNPDTGMYTSPEMATPQQARMAWHRDMASQEAAQVPQEPAPGTSPPTGETPTIEERHGEYHAPGRQLAEIQATKEPPGFRTYREAVARKLGLEADVMEEDRRLKKEKELGKTFETKYTALHGPPPKLGDPGYPAYYDAYQHAIKAGDTEAGFQRHRENVDIQRYKPAFTEENIKALGLPFTMEELDTMSRDEPDVARRTILKFGPMLAGHKEQVKRTGLGKLWYGEPTEVGP